MEFSVATRSWEIISEREMFPPGDVACGFDHALLLECRC